MYVRIFQLVTRKLLNILFLVTFSSQLAAQNCEERFHGIDLLPNAKYCRIYDAKNPSALIYFAPLPLKEAVAFYQSSLSLEAERQTAYSIALWSQDKPYRIILNEDPNGTQISILVPKT